MQINKRAMAVAVLSALGTSAVAMSNASAQVVADGTYNLVINTTPTTADAYGNTSFKFGVDGNWKSSFTFGGVAPNAASQGMTDNGNMVASNGGPKGSSIGGDTWAGILGITVTGNTFTVNGVPGMGGTIDNAGVMSLGVTGRLGAVSSFPMLYDERWNVDDCAMSASGCSFNGNASTYQSFSTTSATTFNSTGAVTINGTAVAAQGDVNADAITDYKAILVSGGIVGSDWGGFWGAGYLEVWNIQLRSTNAAHSGFNVDTIAGTAGGDFAQYVNTTVIPVPAAVWLFGSGLLGLVGIARRKKKA